MPDLTVQMTEPLQAVALDFNAEDVGNPPFSGSADFFFDLQYGFPDPFSHGTHAAGSVAAAQNDFGNGGWYWSVGMSMASPHAAGVAAPLIGANGGSMHPAQVESLRRAGDSG